MATSKKKDEDKGADLLNQNVAQWEKAKGGHKAHIAPFVPLIGHEVFYKTDDNWYAYVTVRDLRWAFGRVDILIEQGDRVYWTKWSRCFAPPGQNRATGIVPVVQGQNPAGDAVPEDDARGGESSST